MLQLNGVSKRFDDGFLALENIDLTVAGGEIATIIGSSGCGKSTLLRLAAGLDTPTTGEVRIGSHVVDGPGADVGVVFQEPRLMPWLTVEENVRFGLSRLPKSEARGLASEAIERVGLGGFAASLPRQLSGGMAQRVAIARAFVVKPPVLLLDEPFSALDAFTRLDLQDHLLELWEWYRPTLVIVTHDIDEAAALADRIVVMAGNPGHVAAAIPVDLRRPRVRTDGGFHDLRDRVLTTLSAAGVGGRATA